MNTRRLINIVKDIANWKNLFNSSDPMPDILHGNSNLTIIPDRLHEADETGHTIEISVEKKENVILTVQPGRHGIKSTDV